MGFASLNPSYEVGRGICQHPRGIKVFFASFCSQKEVLSFLWRGLKARRFPLSRE
jgi:hypothetical protein